MLGIVYVRIQFGAITESKGTQGAAAALLVVPILLSLYLVRTNEHPMTTHLLWPLRIVATAPGLLSLLAAGVLVGSVCGACIIDLDATARSARGPRSYRRLDEPIRRRH